MTAVDMSEFDAAIADIESATRQIESAIQRGFRALGVDPDIPPVREKTNQKGSLTNMTSAQLRITPTILGILANCSVVGKHVALPPGQLDRATYSAVDKVLTLMGGKWNRGKKVHVFPESPADLLDTVILTGEITDKKKLFQQFYTPVAVVDYALDLADIHFGQRILEPEAGKGVFLQRLILNYALRAAVAVELDPDNISGLLEYADRVHHGDFLQCSRDPIPGGRRETELGGFDRIVMNPPFTRGQDVKHIQHALTFLKPGGRLVAICGDGPKQQDVLRPLADRWESLPPSTFAESGTNVNTAVMVIRG